VSESERGCVAFTHFLYPSFSLSLSLSLSISGYWADCKPYGVRAELEKELMKSGEECSSKSLDSCEIEALRPEAYR
jgi:hypothetical protein